MVWDVNLLSQFKDQKLTRSKSSPHMTAAQNKPANSSSEVKQAPASPKVVASANSNQMSGFKLAANFQNIPSDKQADSSDSPSDVSDPDLEEAEGNFQEAGLMMWDDDEVFVPLNDNANSPRGER
jgi:hypothetical protein